MMKSIVSIFILLLLCFSWKCHAAKNIIHQKDSIYDISVNRFEYFNSVTDQYCDLQPVECSWVKHNLLPFTNFDTTNVKCGIRGTFLRNGYKFLVYNIDTKGEYNMYLAAINTCKRYPPTLLIMRKSLDEDFSRKIIKFGIADSVITIRKSIINNGFPIAIQESFKLDSCFTWLNSIPEYLPLDSWMDNPSTEDIVLNEDESTIADEQPSNSERIPKSLWDGQFIDFHNFKIPKLKTFPQDFDELQTLDAIGIRLKPDIISKYIWYLQDNVRFVLCNSREIDYMYRALGIYHYEGLEYLLFNRTTGFGIDYFIASVNNPECFYPPLLLIGGDNEVTYQLNNLEQSLLYEFMFHVNNDRGPMLNIIRSFDIDSCPSELYQNHWIIYPEFQETGWAVP